MRFAVLGGSGFLGRSIAQRLLDSGHDVVGVARRGVAPHLAPQVPDAAGPGRFTSVALDATNAPDGELERVLEGVDGIAFAYGPDDRKRTPIPAADYFMRELAAPTERVAGIAARLGVRTLVITGSYFSYVDRTEPQLRLSEHHSYIRARNAQALRAIAAGGSTTAVSVLEVPWVFGSIAHHTPQWKSMLWEPMRRSPFGFALPGSTALVSNTALAQAAENLLTGQVAAGRHPLATANLDHHRMAEVALAALGQGSKRIVDLSPRMMRLTFLGELARIRLIRKDSGIDPRHAVELLGRQLDIDPALGAVPLGLEPEDAEQLVRDNVAFCYGPAPAA